MAIEYINNILWNIFNKYLKKYKLTLPSDFDFDDTVFNIRISAFLASNGEHTFKNKDVSINIEILDFEQHVKIDKLIINVRIVKYEDNHKKSQILVNKNIEIETFDTIVFFQTDMVMVTSDDVQSDSYIEPMFMYDAKEFLDDLQSQLN
jgi:hypothetical protein